MQSDSSHVIRVLIVSSGAVTTLAGRQDIVTPCSDGTGTAATFYFPVSVCLNSAGTFALVVGGGEDVVGID
jgi:hypothetical protein